MTFPFPGVMIIREVKSVPLLNLLRGRVQFPTGSIVCEAHEGPNRCDSGTDSTVWMREGFLRIPCVRTRPDLIPILYPGVLGLRGFFH